MIAATGAACELDHCRTSHSPEPLAASAAVCRADKSAFGKSAVRAIFTLAKNPCTSGMGKHSSWTRELPSIKTI